MKKLSIALLILCLSIVSHSQSCLPAGIIFDTQAQIDSFQVNYPSCTGIEGDVVIGNPDGTNITSLAGLDVLTFIGGSLHIGGNHNLLTLSGLENLTSIGGNFRTYVIESTPNSIYQVGNYNLTSLTGLENLAYIGGDLEIINNPVLSTCDFEWICDYLSNPNGTIDIHSNDPGCQSIFEVGYNCGGTYPCLPQGRYFFSNQWDIDHFAEVFPDCTTLTDDVDIFGFNDIYNLHGLHEIEEITGYFGIFDCMYLEDLQWLENLGSIGGGLYIEYNKLKSLHGLENITSINGAIIILGNDSLVDLKGIYNIDGATISSLYISENPNLSSCETMGICEYLGDPPGSTIILENAPGCNHKSEILDACYNGSEEMTGATDRVSIYPNPSPGYLIIRNSGDRSFNHANVSLRNTEGQSLIETEINGAVNYIDLSAIPPGLYILRIVDEKDIFIEKVLKR